jgi:hypothetical protein
MKRKDPPHHNRDAWTLAGYFVLIPGAGDALFPTREPLRIPNTKWALRLLRLMFGRLGPHSTGVLTVGPRFIAITNYSRNAVRVLTDLQDKSLFEKREEAEALAQAQAAYHDFTYHGILD